VIEIDFKMEIDAENEQVLHETMLNYVFNKKQLPSACFNWFWEDFKRENAAACQNVPAGKFVYQFCVNCILIRANFSRQLF
jgi:hypothetical protein